MNLTADVPAIDWACYALLIIGAINWGAVGLAEINLLELAIEPIFQPGAAELLVRVVYVLVGLAGLYFFYPLYRISRRTDRRSASGN